MLHTINFRTKYNDNPIMFPYQQDSTKQDKVARENSAASIKTEKKGNIKTRRKKVIKHRKLDPNTGTRHPQTPTIVIHEI